MRKLQSFSQLSIDNIDKGVVDTDKVRMRKMLVTTSDVEENVVKSKQLLKAYEKTLAHTC